MSILMPEFISLAKLSDMANDLTDLIELLAELEDVEPDPELEDGQVRGPNGGIITL